MCDKADVQVTAPLSVLAQGITVASLNYRLSHEAIFPAQIYEVKAAIRYFRVHPADHGLDGGIFALWGCSAGGYLELLAATTNDVAVMEDLTMGHLTTSSAVQAVVSFFAPTRLDQMDEHLAQTGAGTSGHLATDSPESRLLGGLPTTCPGLVIAANPETWVTPDCPSSSSPMPRLTQLFPYSIP